MHRLNVALNQRVHNLAHFGCDAHSIANWERELLRAEAETRAQVTSQLSLLVYAVAAFAAGFLAIYAF
jgi:hypothetical protein